MKTITFDDESYELMEEVARKEGLPVDRWIRFQVLNALLERPEARIPVEEASSEEKTRRFKMISLVRVNIESDSRYQPQPSYSGAAR
jgi:hypothetical protein